MTKIDTFAFSSDLSVGRRPEFKSDEFGICIILVIEILSLIIVESRKSSKFFQSQ